MVWRGWWGWLPPSPQPSPSRAREEEDGRWVCRGVRHRGCGSTRLYGDFEPAHHERVGASSGRGRLETGPYARGDARRAKDGRVGDPPLRKTGTRGARKTGDWIPAEDAGMTEGRRAGGVVTASVGGSTRLYGDFEPAHHERVGASSGRGRLETGPYARGDARRAKDGRVGDPPLRKSAPGQWG